VYWGLDTFYGVIRIVSKTPPSPSGVFEKCLRHPNGGLQPRAPPAQIGYWKPLLPRFCRFARRPRLASRTHAIDAALRRRHAATALRVVTPCEGSMSATGEPSAKRAKPVDAAAERAQLLTTLLQYQASRKPADDAAAVGQAEAACEAQLRESLTAAVLQLPPSRVVSKSALAAFKQQHAAMCRVNAAATLTSKMDPASAEAPDAKPPAQADEPVKSEL
jgi:hypothetical protein